MSARQAQARSTGTHRLLRWRSLSRERPRRSRSRSSSRRCRSRSSSRRCRSLSRERLLRRSRELSSLARPRSFSRRCSRSRDDSFSSVPPPSFDLFSPSAGDANGASALSTIPSNPLVHHFHPRSAFRLGGTLIPRVRFEKQPKAPTPFSNLTLGPHPLGPSRGRSAWPYIQSAIPTPLHTSKHSPPPSQARLEPEGGWFLWQLPTQ